MQFYLFLIQPKLRQLKWSTEETYTRYFQYAV